MDILEDSINYRFKSKVWLVEALTHRSAIDQHKLIESLKEHHDMLDDSFGLNSSTSSDHNDF